MDDVATDKEIANWVRTAFPRTRQLCKVAGSVAPHIPGHCQSEMPPLRIRPEPPKIATLSGILAAYPHGCVVLLPGGRARCYQPVVALEIGETSLFPHCREHSQKGQHLFLVDPYE